MKVGDLVKWVGWDSYTAHPGEHGILGVIISISPEDLVMSMAGHRELRYDVLWGGGKIGRKLFLTTLELISESR